MKIVLLAVMLGMVVLPTAAQDDAAAPEQQAAFIVECQRDDGGLYFSTTIWSEGDYIYTQVVDDTTLRLAFVTARGKAQDYRRNIPSLGSLQLDVGKLICANSSEWMAAVQDMEVEVAADQAAMHFTPQGEMHYLAPPVLLFEQGWHQVQLDQPFKLSEDGPSWRYIKKDDEVILQILRIINTENNLWDWTDRFDDSGQVAEGERLSFKSVTDGMVIFEVLVP